MKHTELAVEAVKALPATPVPVMTMLGYSVSDWASAATLLYVVLLATHYVYKNFIKSIGTRE